MFNISVTGTTITGSYYSYGEYIVDVLVSGTCWEIHTGTAEIEQVVQAFAFEGQWFVKPNDQNILVADVELMPVRRNVSHKTLGSSYVNIGFEHPHHFRSPTTLNGDVELLFDSGASNRCVGVGQWGDYLFTRSLSSGAVHKINRKTGVEDAWGGPPVPGYNPSFSVIDKDHVVVYALGEAWYMMDWINSTITEIGSVPLSAYYYPHWAVIKDILCVGTVYEISNYPAAPSWTTRWYGNWMFNIWTGEQLFGEISPSFPADAFVDDLVVKDVVIEKSFFWVVAKTSGNGGTWPEVVGPEPSVLYKMSAYPDSTLYGPVQNFTYKTEMIKLYYDQSAPYGDLEIEDMAYNPEDKMLYLIFYGYNVAGTNDYAGIIKMSPENLSYSIIYSISLPATIPPYPDKEPTKFFRSKDKLYVALTQGSASAPPPPSKMYDVLDLNTPLWTFPTFYSNIGDWDSGVTVVDVNNRGWYMGNVFLGDQTILYGINFETGIIEVEIDTGITEPWGDKYYYPTPFPYRQIIVADDSILIFSHNTYQPAYQGRPYIADENTFIYKVT